MKNNAVDHILQNRFGQPSSNPYQGCLNPFLTNAFEEVVYPFPFPSVMGK